MQTQLIFEKIYPIWENHLNLKNNDLQLNIIEKRIPVSWKLYDDVRKFLKNFISLNINFFGQNCPALEINGNDSIFIICKGAQIFEHKEYVLKKNKFLFFNKPTKVYTDKSALLKMQQKIDFYNSLNLEEIVSLYDVTQEESTLSFETDLYILTLGYCWCIIPKEKGQYLEKLIKEFQIKKDFEILTKL